ncbi:MAG: InlB B-repeat-containing protein, partial [Nocardioidaceae bacterium]
DNLDSYGYACAWRFERGEGVSHDASTSRLVTMTPALAGIAGFEGWTGQYPGAVNLLYPVIGMNTGAEFNYEGFTVPSGRVLVHPAPEHTAIVRWRSPFTGYVKVTGAATDLDPDSGDGVRWTIDRNTTILAEGAVHDSSQAFGGGALAAVPVAKGDTLAFIVAPGEAGYFDDTTQLDVVIERIPPPQRTLTVLLDPADGEGGGVTSGDDPKTIDCRTLCEAGYPDATDVDLTPTAKPGWKFVRWEGACSGAGPCTVAMTEPRTVTAVFEREQHELTVEIRREGDGSGRVDSSDGKIDCDPRCVETYPHGTSVTLRHHAGQGSRFVGWVGGGCTALGDCVVQVDAARKVVARFVKLTRLYVQVEPHGGGTVSATPGGIDACTLICHADYDAGTAVTIEAKPAPGWRFVRYADDPCGSGAKCELEMDADRTVTARFEQIDPPQQLVVDVVPPNAGRVTTDPPGIDGCQTYCRATFPNGTAVALHAQELPGYRFKRLTSSSCPATSRDCAFTMNQSRFVTAEFEKVGGPYKLTVLFYPPGGGQVRVEPPGDDCVANRPFANWGSVHCRYQFAGETPVVMEATPKPGHVFRRWILGPCNNSRARRCAFTLTKNEDTTAEFVKTGPIKATVGQNGVSQALRGTVTYRPPTTPGRAARAAQAADEADDLPFFPLDKRQAMPVGSTIDATAGALRLTVRNARGRQEQIDLSGGMFVFRQAAKGRRRGRTFLELPDPCAAPGNTGGSQRLEASGGGGFLIRSRFSESTTRRATWTTENRCDGTKTKVSKGMVIVRDLKKKRAVTLRAGHSHTARASRR